MKPIDYIEGSLTKELVSILDMLDVITLKTYIALKEDLFERRMLHLEKSIDYLKKTDVRTLVKIPDSNTIYDKENI